MKEQPKSKFRFLLIAGLLLLAISAVSFTVLAQNDRFAVPWWSIDGGGGKSQGTRFGVTGPIGQPDAGYGESATYTLTGGFWAGIPRGISLFLPVIRDRLSSCYFLPTETEPNNSASQANGPLCAGLTVTGTPLDADDYFYLQSGSSGNITIDLTNHTGSGVQLLLYDEAFSVLVQDAAPPYSISYNGPAGKYNIRIFTESGYNNTEYSMIVNFP